MLHFQKTKYLCTTTKLKFETADPNAMFKIINFICMFVLIFHAHSSYGATMNVFAITNYYKIYFDLINSSNLYQCLANSTAGSCLLYLKNEIDRRYEIRRITQEMSEKIFIPQYICYFTSDSYIWAEEDHKYKCLRRELNIISAIKEKCSLYDFVIRWKNTQEYFIDDSLVNCSIDSVTFAYRRVSVLLSSTTESTADFVSLSITLMSSSLFNSKHVMPYKGHKDQTVTSYTATYNAPHYNDYLLAAVISTSSLLFISIIAILYLSLASYRRKSNSKKHNYSLTEFRQRDSHIYEGASVTIDEHVVTYINARENNYVPNIY